MDETDIGKTTLVDFLKTNGLDPATCTLEDVLNFVPLANSLKSAQEAQVEAESKADELLEAKREAEMAEQAVAQNFQSLTSEKDALMAEKTNFKSASAEVLKNWAGLDPDACSLADIAKVIQDLRGENERLTDRAERAADLESLATDETILGLKEALSKLQTELAASAADWAELSIQLRDIREQMATQIADLQDKVIFEQEKAASQRGTAQAVIQVVLMRPVGFLQLYGEEIYQTLREVFQAFDGDMSTLPQEILPENR